MRNKEGLVDDLITSIPGEWKFDEQVSQHFDTHVRKSVPLYEEVQKAVIEISEWFIRDNSVVYDLGSSTGETISLLLQKHSRKKNVRFIGVEESLPMIEIARKKCSSELVQFLQQHIEEINEFANIDLVLSLYTLQFLPLWKRKKVLQRIYNGLVEGGAFIFVEKIRAENSLFEDIWNDLYWDFKQENGLNEQQVIKKAQSLRGVLIPLSLTENLSLLSDVGFQCMDTFIKWHNFAGIIAVKMPSKNDIEENTYLNTDKNNNYRIFCGPYRVVLTNFETLETEKQQFELYLKVRNVGIIIDESAKLKNPNSKLTKTYFELAPLFQRRIIMTGTPVANRPYDIWAQIYFLDFGESLGADFNEFKKETDLSNKLSRNTDLQEEFEDNISQIFNRISSFTVRETKNSGIITLPDKVYIQEVTEFNRMQEELYERIRTELYAEVVRDGERYIDDSSAIVKRLLRLIQVTSNPKLVDEECEASAKEPLLDELIQKILANGEKCIVWSNFIENIDYFTKKYQDLGAVKIHGKMNMDARNRSVQKFHDDDIRILFATPASAKEGLTLTMANHVIFYDRGFSLDDYLQAQDRIHRISQKKTCYVHNIIIKDSIDEWVDLLLKAKQNAAALSQGDISLGDYQGVADYSFGDIVKSILGFEEVDE